MRRRIGGRWSRLRGPLLWGPLLCSVLPWVSGCTVPKPLGLAQQPEPQPQRQVAEERVRFTAPDAEAVGSPMMFVATSPKKTSWFSLHRDKAESAESAESRTTCPCRIRTSEFRL